MTAEEFVTVKEQLDNAVTYCLSMKRTHKNGPKVPYIKYPGGKWQCVPKKDREEYIAKAEEKRQLQDRYHKMLAKLQAMSRAERKDFRQQLKLFSIIKSINLSLEANQMATGSCRASKSEVIANDIIDRLGLPYEYEPSIYANGHPYNPDFRIRNILWEHMGRTNPDYLMRHDNKFHDYMVEGYHFIITKDHPAQNGGNSYIKIPEILWTLVSAGIVSAAKVLKTYYPNL